MQSFPVRFVSNKLGITPDKNKQTSVATFPTMYCIYVLFFFYVLQAWDKCLVAY